MNQREEEFKRSKNPFQTRNNHKNNFYFQNERPQIPKPQHGLRERQKSFDNCSFK